MPLTRLADEAVLPPEFASLAPGSTHELDGSECPACPQTWHAATQRSFDGRHHQVVFTFTHPDALGWEWAVTATIEYVATFDDWGRSTGKSRTAVKLLAVDRIETTATPPLPPPPRPENAVDSFAWNDDGTVTVTQWGTTDDGYGTSWRWESSTATVHPTGEGEWVAVYWRHYGLYADRWDIEDEAWEDLKFGSDDGHLSPVGVIRDGEAGQFWPRGGEQA